MSVRIGIALLLTLHVAQAQAAGPEVVVANEVLLAGGDKVPAAMEAFVRRIETVGGWPAGTLRGKAFSRPREALDYIRKNKVPFAFLPPHQLVEGRKELKLEVIGRAVGLDGPEGGYWGVARNETHPWEHIEEYPGLRLATTEIDDLVWLRVLMEGNVRAPQKHFQLVEVPSGSDALAAVLGRKADVALLSQADFAPIKARVDRRDDLIWVYASGTVPAPAIVATKWARPADRKKLVAALEKLCKKEGGDICGRMGIVYIQADHAADYATVIRKYETYRY
jgi:ABC-type phosphate/phosphonate transport system substrate-binding protein